MGPGDLVPEAIEAWALQPHVLTEAELSAGDLSAWNVLVIGIRAYSTRPELARGAAEPRRVCPPGRNAHRAVPEQQLSRAVSVVDGTHGGARGGRDRAGQAAGPGQCLLAWPNKISAADFDGWIEERGHSFLDSWDSGYTALTETADPDQAPQRGGLLVAHPGKGTYIYVAYALYRQLTRVSARILPFAG
jgi:hypothetical protein